MSDQASNALIALALGSAVAVLLFVPTAAWQYRLDGRLTLRDLTVLVAAAVYGWALWTYTLLPTPMPGYTCQEPQLDPLAAFRPVYILGLGNGPLDLLRDPAFFQVALNVVLFVPLGYFVRRILRRGVVAATAIGLGLSGLIELTQLTGAWGLYDCAYRLFDVADLGLNTLGALVGSALAALVVDTDAAPRPLPRTISRGRRLVGMVSDALAILLLGAAAAAVYRIYALSSTVEFDPDTALAVQIAVPWAVEAALVLARGRTLGELAIAARAEVRGGREGRGGRGVVLMVVARAIKLLGGLSPVFVLVLLGGWWTLAGVPAYLLVTAAAAMLSPPGTGRRGLSHALARMDLRVATDEAFDVERVGDAVHLVDVDPGGRR